MTKLSTPVPLFSRLAVPAVAILCLPLSACTEEKTAGSGAQGKKAEAKSEPAHTNRLADEKSPYLLQHAHNPVDWYPWGEEAFEKARKENKMIFLSVGYATCHWCHVMERESFSDPEIAAAMNENFVNIKLDREERPDIDRVYMTFVQATTGGGGWPMSVWLTPDLEPVVGGTYFPPEDKFGRPGFASIVEQLGEAWEKDEDRMREQAGQVVEQLRRFASGATSATVPGEDDDRKLDASELERGYESFAERFDEKEGGFGPAPKFPRPSELAFLFAEAERSGLESERGARALEMATFTLEKMAAGGMHDHLGGGFHRYSVDERWHVPHFEKMLYDQAQLADVYLTAHRLTGREDFADTARDILDYVLRDMTGEHGAFFSAEDADSYVDEPGGEKAEGAFYVWTAEEIEAVLGEERAAEFAYVYGVEDGGNAKPDGDPHGELRGKNVLYLAHTGEEAAKKFDVDPDEMEKRLASSREALFAARNERPRPLLDDKVIVAWNGLMTSAFARGHRVLGEERYLEAAREAATFLRERLYDPETRRLTRVWREGPSDIGGFVEDYAYLVSGLIDLYLSDPDTAWLEWALDLQATQDELFGDEEDGGYFSSTGEDPTVLLRMKENHDGAEPSPNSVSALNLLRLSHLLADSAYEERAHDTLTYLGPHLTATPAALPLALTALERAMSPGVQVVIVGDRSAPDAQSMLAAVHERHLPGAVWAVVDDESREWFASRAEFYRSVEAIDGKPTGYLCRNFVCELPTSDPEQFRRQLEAQDPTRDETKAR